ncbi:hypothetical protein MLD38_006652 [Melastoma candidum]|uniref:Uncharacterized protein n=1 Tax=Melastoma candidum TaxID=119954 RepID=A0ACB9RSC1_9MYRT|nr:hypothetical protein MLD38_006652 [Melastoma candidum]
MSEFSAELEEILALTASPNVDGNRTLAYSKLLCLQGRSSDNPSSIRALGESCGSILPHLVSDIPADDEEIAALALKCLGFMIYHPMIVAVIPGNVAGEVLASIAEVARTTKMKLVCNLGMWCISMQQLDEEAIRGHFQLLVMAVVHAIDNPFGSLSTTFEAFQAVIKLVEQTDQMMRESSDLWLPPTYRRLLSDDKRARDMAVRCLLKIKPTVIPPTLMLFKAVRIDLKDSLLLKMKEMIKDGYKVQAVQAWGWLIRLLGNYATKDRHVFNDMLKVLESAFLDSDPQVQIASQVAWQGLVEAVIPPLLTGKEKDMGKQTPDREKFTLDVGESRINGLLRILKLIMTPIVGIVSSQCNLAVRSACFDTWSILLHKLHTLVNHQAIRTVVLKPVFEVVFRKKEENVGNGSWDLCLDMLDHSMLPPEGRRTTLASDNVILDSLEHVTFSRSTWRQYPMKLLPFVILSSISTLKSLKC